MSDQRFDDILKKKLSEAKTSTVPDWDNFEKIKIKSDIKVGDKIFDDFVNDSMNHYKSKSQHQWPILHARMTYIFELQKNIHSIKFTEAVSMLLLLLFFFIGTYTEKIVKEFSGSDDAMVSIQDAAIQDSEFILPTENVGDELKSFSSSQLSSERKTFVPNKKEEKSNLLIKPQQYLAKNLLDNKDLASTNSFDESPSTVTQDINEVELNEDKKAESNHELTKIAMLDQLESHIVYSREVNIGSAIGIEMPLKSEPLSECRKIQLYSSFNNNKIFTPDDLKYNTSARTTEMYGYSVGMLYSKKRQKIELESGLIYSSFNKPWNFNLQYGNSFGWYSFNMTNVHYEMLAVPVNVKLHFIENSDWSMFVQATVSNDVIIISDYERTTTYLGGGSLPVGMEPEIPEIVLSPFEEERNFDEGFFQGGNIIDNYLMRVGVGAGLERNISDSMSLYFSGIYYKNVINSSIGPNNDRLDKLSFAIGLTMKI